MPKHVVYEYHGGPRDGKQRGGWIKGLNSVGKPRPQYCFAECVHRGFRFGMYVFAGKERGVLVMRFREVQVESLFPGYQHQARVLERSPILARTICEREERSLRPIPQ